MSYAAANIRGRLGSYVVANTRGRLGQLDLSSLLMGGSSSDALSSAAGLGADAILPGSGAVVAPVVSSIEQIFGSSTTGKNAERQAHMYQYYEEAQTSPGSPASVDAVETLIAISLQGVDPVSGEQENNPQATRTYAAAVLQHLATQGWVGITTGHPQYTGVLASGDIYGLNTSTGQEGAIGSRPLPSSGAVTLGALITPGRVIGAAVVVGLIVILTGHHGQPTRVIMAAPASNPPRRGMALPRYNPPHRRRRRSRR